LNVPPRGKKKPGSKKKEKGKDYLNSAQEKRKKKFFPFRTGGAPNGAIAVIITSEHDFERSRRKKKKRKKRLERAPAENTAQVDDRKEKVKPRHLPCSRKKKKTGENCKRRKKKKKRKRGKSGETQSLHGGQGCIANKRGKDRVTTGGLLRGEEGGLFGGGRGLGRKMPNIHWRTERYRKKKHVGVHAREKEKKGGRWFLRVGKEGKC